jgi:hypothetical protein
MILSSSTVSWSFAISTLQDGKFESAALERELVQMELVRHGPVNLKCTPRRALKLAIGIRKMQFLGNIAQFGNSTPNRN